MYEFLVPVRALTPAADRRPPCCLRGVLVGLLLFLCIAAALAVVWVRRRRRQLEHARMQLHEDSERPFSYSFATSADAEARCAHSLETLRINPCQLQPCLIVPLRVRAFDTSRERKCNRAPLQVVYEGIFRGGESYDKGDDSSTCVVFKPLRLGPMMPLLMSMYILAPHPNLITDDCHIFWSSCRRHVLSY